ncbi:cytochrome P450 [Nonomuraea soli]|uniref:Pentalenolactone synthase n=1 Tax=Nonomuraea soli TaxID=1032476 RepID=A0A7W0CPY8_9ACTN|nr:cytochrome P450 [Nonomuraea soli]MBA2895034.1 pentalenolactone synthase [Nonomuraea soli]
MTPQLPFPAEHPLEVPPLLRALAAQGPVHRVRTRVGHEALLVTGYEEVKKYLSDERLGRSHPDPANAARTGESALFGGPRGGFETELEEHARMRELLQPHFSPKRMRAFTPRVEALTDQLIDAMTSPADLCEALALPLPILVICELLGVPYEDRPQFRAWSQQTSDVTNRELSEQGLFALYGYGQELVRRKRKEPGDDFISRMIDTVSDDEIAMLSMAMLFAGHETTVVAIELGALFLLENRSQWELLVERPELIQGAVDEMLRTPADAIGVIPRYARTDLDICGAAVKTGDLVVLDTSAANHDAQAFPEPDRFDITRDNAHHITFGHGLRYCIGAPLARIELRVVFGKLVERCPGLRLAIPVEQIQRQPDKLTSGVDRLPVTF